MSSQADRRTESPPPDKTQAVTAAALRAAVFCSWVAETQLSGYSARLLICLNGRDSQGCRDVSFSRARPAHDSKPGSSKGFPEPQPLQPSVETPGPQDGVSSLCASRILTCRDGSSPEVPISQTERVGGEEEGGSEMKAAALSVRECAWMSEECHLLDERRSDSRSDSVCLPNIFRTRKVRPLAKAPPGPSYQVYHTARELLLKVLDREAVRLLVRRAAAAHSGPAKEQSADLSRSEYAEALTWFSVVLQKGVSAVGSGQPPDSQLGLRMDGWQAVLKRSSFQSCLCSLSRLDGGDQLEALWSFCRHLIARFQDLYTPGRRLAVKKYRLSCQQETCRLHLALLCDLASGFICNMFLYCPEKLRRQSRRPVVGQVVEQLLRPFCRKQHKVQLDRSAWAQGRLVDVLSSSGLNIDLVDGEIPTEDQKQQQQQQKQQQQQQQHPLPLQGWTGPALFPPADLRRPTADVFLPGLWVALHITYINTFTLHCLQNLGSGRRPRLTEFTRALASRLAADSSVAAPPLAHLSSASLDWSASSKQRWQAGDGSQRLPPPPPGMLGVCGLDNSGNSCYLNAVLQCLCSTVPLVEHLLHRDTRRELAKSDCRVVEAFVRLLEEMWTGRSSSCAPVEATTVLFSVLPQFNDQAQHDAQELLLFLLNALHDDLQKAAKQRQTLPPTRQWARKRTCGWATGEPTMVSRLFQGQLSYAMVCLHCEHRARSTQAFTILSLPIPRDARSCSIQDCLSLFFRQTVLSGGEQVLCSECGLRRETLVLTALDQPPDIVVLHLKRFGCKGKNQVKLRTNVTFSTELDLAPFLSSSALNTSCSSYHLYAVVNHAGTLNMGHYTALCHNAVTQTWHYFDDSVVREVKGGPVQSANAYMLLYSRRPLDKPKILGL